MTTVAPTTAFPQTVLPTQWTLADLQRHVGDVPLERIRLYPPPGMATEDDALQIHAREGRLCELVDGILVEKEMASFESLLAGLLIQWLNNFLDERPLGVVLGEAGALRILPRRMRIPEVSFISWDRLPDHRLPVDRVYRVAPDLAIEILSEGNTAQEMELKLDEYRQAGVRLIWYIDPRARTATVHTGEGSTETLDENGVLQGGNVLPGFELPLRDLLDRYER